MKVQTRGWETVVRTGAEKSVLGLASMLGHPLKVTSLTLDKLSIDGISDRLGGPEQRYTVVYLNHWGSASGHMTLLFDPRVTSRLLELLVGRSPAPGQKFDEIERSSLGELGNLVASSFLNSISDATGLLLRPSPPDVIVDMVGAVIDIVATDVMAEDIDLYLAEVKFSSEELQIEGTFLMIPSAQLLAAIEEQLERRG